jgi:hypothetical protein
MCLDKRECNFAATVAEHKEEVEVEVADLVAEVVVAVGRQEPQELLH